MDATGQFAILGNLRQAVAQAVAWIARAEQQQSSRRAVDYPISRWYLRPAATVLAHALATSRVRPWMVTLTGLAIATLAGALLAFRPEFASWSALLVLGTWFCDRLDGQLARRQGSASALGAWLDANVDELVDLGLHVALAGAAAASAASAWPWALLIGFLIGKYLLMYGLQSEAGLDPTPAAPAEFNAHAGRPRWWRGLYGLYHLPGNADVRIHLLVAALFTGWWTAELALICVYYNFRWIVRYALVARRLGALR